MADTWPSRFMELSPLCSLFKETPTTFPAPNPDLGLDGPISNPSWSIPCQPRVCEKMGTGSGPAMQNPDDIDVWPVPVPIFSQTLSPSRPLFFVHVPKAAGCSIRRFLESRFPTGAIRWLRHDDGSFAPNRLDLGRHICYAGHEVFRFGELLP